MVSCTHRHYFVGFLVLLLSIKVSQYNAGLFPRKIFKAKCDCFFMASFTFVRYRYCIVEFSSVRIDQLDFSFFVNGLHSKVV